MSLIDHGVCRTGKEGAANKALTGGSELCGPDQHAMAAKMRMNKRRGAMLDRGSIVTTNDWEAEMQDYRDCEKIERRKTRGGATFRPGDAC